MGTPSDCTAPSTSHNRGPSTAYVSVSPQNSLQTLSRRYNSANLAPLPQVLLWDAPQHGGVEIRRANIKSIINRARLDLPPEARKMEAILWW